MSITFENPFEERYEPVEPLARVELVQHYLRGFLLARGIVGIGPECFDPDSAGILFDYSTGGETVSNEDIWYLTQKPELL